MEKHTPEPWTTEKTGIYCRWGALPVNEANAARIVACVNALEGIPTEALEAGVIKEMVEALKEIAEGANDYRPGHINYNLRRTRAEIQIIARTILAKIGGN